MLLAAGANLVWPGVFSLREAAAIGIIGAADGPTSIYVGNLFAPKYMGAITVAAYSYMALVPIIQPPVIKALTTKKNARSAWMLTTASKSRKRLRFCSP